MIDLNLILKQQSKRLDCISEITMHDSDEDDLFPETDDETTASNRGNPALTRNRGSLKKK